MEHLAQKKFVVPHQYRHVYNVVHENFDRGIDTQVESTDDAWLAGHYNKSNSPVGGQMNFRKNRSASLVALRRAAPLLWRERRNPELVKVMRSYAGWMPLCIFSEPGLWLVSLSKTRSRFRFANQRPRAFYVSHLPARPVKEADETARFLEANAAAICEEFVLAAGIDRKNPSKRLVTAGSWQTRPLIRAGRRDQDNIARFPVTWSVVQRCPIPNNALGDAYFSILEPGTRIKPHCAPTNLRVRYHLTIQAAEGARIRIGDEWRSWEPGRCLVLDDSIEHEVVHDGEAYRVILIVDCWPEDLNHREREFITALHERWSDV